MALPDDSPIVTEPAETHHRALGSPRDKARQARVTKEPGRVVTTLSTRVISLHRAQRTVAEHEWVPVVQEAIAEVVHTA